MKVTTGSSAVDGEVGRERRLKVAIFVSYLPPHVGGIEVVAENQVKSLASGGYEVSVVTSACDAQAGLRQYQGYRIRRVPAWNYLEKRMGVVFPIFAPSLLVHGYREVKAADIVHVHDAFYLTSLVAAFWARFLRKPLVLTQHVDLIPHPRRFVSLAQQAVYATTGRFILCSSRRIIVLNSRVRTFLVDRGVNAARITFLPNGVDTAIFRPPIGQQKDALRQEYGLPRDKILALFVGRFVPKKGLAKLLEVETLENLELIFAGGLSPSGHARADHHFLGPVRRDAIADVFRLCDVFVLPSQGEGFPVTVQEAMASGLPVIMGDDPAYGPYGLDESLVRFVQPSSEDLRKTLDVLAADGELRRRMARYSRQYALDNFSWHKHIEELGSIYRTEVGSVSSA